MSVSLAPLVPPLEQAGTDSMAGRGHRLLQCLIALQGEGRIARQAAAGLADRIAREFGVVGDPPRPSMLPEAGIPAGAGEALFDCACRWAWRHGNPREDDRWMVAILQRVLGLDPVRAQDLLLAARPHGGEPERRIACDPPPEGRVVAGSLAEGRAAEVGGATVGG